MWETFAAPQHDPSFDKYLPEANPEFNFLVPTTGREL